MATDYNAFLGNVMPHVNGCPPAMAIDAVRDAVIQLCQEARIWTVEHAAIDVVTDQGSYAFAPPAGTVVAEVLQVWYAGKRIDPYDVDVSNNIYTSWMTEKGQPTKYTQLDERNLRLIPIPQETVTGAVTLLVTLKPSKTSTTVDDRIYEQYDNIIANGALAYLLTMPKTPGRDWPDTKLGAMNASQFQEGIDKAKSKASRGYVRSRKHVRGVYF
jgi:hypothetical protein